MSTHLCNKLGGGESSHHVAECVHVSGARVRAGGEGGGGVGGGEVHLGKGEVLHRAYWRGGGPNVFIGGAG